MKALLLGLLLASSGAMAAPILSEIEQEDLLQSIDTICGDTWCEGDSNWSFDAIHCDSEKGCVLDLTMKPYDFEEDQILTARPFQCQLPEFTTKDSLVEMTIRGLQHTQELYDVLSDCINELSANYGPIYVPIDNKCPSLFNPKTSSSIYHTSKAVNSSGIYGAIEAISQIVLKKSKSDSTCELVREPYYRDSADCFAIEPEKSLNESIEKAAATQICLLPSIQGSFKVTLDENGQASVEYLPGTLGNNAYKSKVGLELPSR